MLKFIVFLRYVWEMIHGVKMDKIVKVDTNLQRLNRDDTVKQENGQHGVIVCKDEQIQQRSSCP